MSYVSTFDAFQIDNLTAGQKAVLAAIATFERNGKAWPSVATLAKRASMGVRTVQRHLAALINLGYITRTYRAGHAAVTRLFIGETHAKLAPPPLPNWHPESGIPESVNQITAAPASPSPAAADAAIAVSEQIPEQPAITEVLVAATPVEPSQDVGATYPLPEVAQSTVGRSMASISEPMAENPVVELENPAFELPDTPLQVAVDPLVDVPATLLQDLGEVRKAKKRTPKPTRTEANLWFAEAQKAGWTMQQVVLTMVLHGWSRFEASWVQHVPQQAVQGPQAVWKPESLPVATPAVVSAARAKLAELRAQIVADSARKRVDQVACRR